jgi:hypothetical protein
MVRDFWSKGLIQRRLRPIPLSSPVLRRQRESTRVLEIFWRRPERKPGKYLHRIHQKRHLRQPMPLRSDEVCSRSVQDIQSWCEIGHLIHRCTRPASYPADAPRIFASGRIPLRRCLAPDVYRIIFVGRGEVDWAPGSQIRAGPQRSPGRIQRFHYQLCKRIDVLVHERHHERESMIVSRRFRRNAASQKRGPMSLADIARARKAGTYQDTAVSTPTDIG